MTIEYDDLERMAGELECALSEISESATGIIALALPTFGDRLITLLNEYDGVVSHLRHHNTRLVNEIDRLRMSLAQADNTLGEQYNEIHKLKADLDGERLGLVRIWVRAGCDKKITMIKHYRDWSGERLYNSKVMIESMMEDPNKSVLVPARMDVSEAALTELFIFEEA